MHHPLAAGGSLPDDVLRLIWAAYFARHVLPELLHSVCKKCLQHGKPCLQCAHHQNYCQGPGHFRGRRTVVADMASGKGKLQLLRWMAEADMQKEKVAVLTLEQVLRATWSGR